MSAQTFTINNTSPSTITVVKFVFDTPNTIGHEFNLTNFGGSSAFTGTEYQCNTAILSGNNKTFTANYSNLVSVPGTFTAKIYVTLDTEQILELTATINITAPSELPYPTAINPVTSVTPIFAEFYNSLKNQVDGLLGDYGYAGMVSKPVAPGETIKLSDWTNLITDFEKTHVHQNHTVFTPTGSTATAINSLITAINQSYTNSSTVAIEQLSSATISSSRSSNWASSILHSSTLTWATSVDLRRYFLLGGKMESRIGYTGSGDLTWGILIQGANTRLKKNSYKWTEYITSSSVWAKASGDGFIWSTDPTSLLDGDILSQGIFLNVRRNTDTIDYHLGFLDAGPTVHTLLPYHTMTYYYSVGDRAVGGFTGIAAPRPTTRTDIGLDGGGAPPVIPNTKVLTASMTSGTFTFTEATNSYYSTVNVNNSGNAPVSITGITYTSNGVTADPSYVGDFGGSPVHSIPPSTLHTFALRYTGPTAGVYNNSFTILSDNDAGNVTVNTRQVITSPAYYFTVSPPSITVTLSTKAYASALLTINEFNGSYFTGPGSYDVTPSLSGPHAGDFILDTTTALGPTIAIDPASKSNGTYNCTVTIQIHGITVTVPIVVNLNVPAALNTNLGNWISPIQKNNGVLGFSYDVINDQRYLTIGFGTGADGSPEITDGTNKTGSYAQATNIDYDSDNGFTLGPVVYQSDSDTGSGTFFKNYAVWIRSSDAGTNRNSPRGVDVSRTFSFTVPTTGDYVWTVSIDYYAVVVIDNAEIYTGGNNYGSSESGTISLDAGSHTITWTNNGDSRGPTGIAIQLKRASDNLDIWNTRTPVRSTSPYSNWAEVYRMPISTSAAQTLRSIDYLQKSWQLLSGYKYGDFFKDRNMFTVVNDGTGDLTISITSDLNPDIGTSDPTITGASELFYYYSSKSIRVENLSSPEGDGTQTRWFRGFDKNGTVKTSLQNYPGSPTGSSGSNNSIPVQEAGGSGIQTQEQ